MTTLSPWDNEFVSQLEQHLILNAVVESQCWVNLIVLYGDNIAKKHDVHVMLTTVKSFITIKYVLIRVISFRILRCSNTNNFYTALGSSFIFYAIFKKINMNKQLYSLVCSNIDTVILFFIKMFALLSVHQHPIYGIFMPYPSVPGTDSTSTLNLKRGHEILHHETSKKKKVNFKLKFKSDA